MSINPALMSRPENFIFSSGLGLFSSIIHDAENPATEVYLCRRTFEVTVRCCTVGMLVSQR